MGVRDCVRTARVLLSPPRQIDWPVRGLGIRNLCVPGPGDLYGYNNGVNGRTILLLALLAVNG